MRCFSKKIAKKEKNIKILPTRELGWLEIRNRIEFFKEKIVKEEQHLSSIEERMAGAACFSDSTREIALYRVVAIEGDGNARATSLSVSE